MNYGLSLSNFLLNQSVISFNAGYGFKDQRWKGMAALLVFLDQQKKIFLEGNLYRKLNYDENQQLITTARNSFTSLLYKGDYRDYYYTEGGNFGIGVRATENLALKMAFVSQYEKNAYNHTRFSLFNYKEPFRLNPGIKQGRFNGIKAALLYRAYNLDIDLVAEYTDKNLLKSDFSYSLIKTSIQKKYRLAEYRLLSLSAAGAISFGELAPQRWFDFGGKTFMNYHGNLRGVGYKTFTGDRMIQTTIEYSIIGSEFYERGLKWGILKALKLQLWNGIGWSSLSSKNKHYALNIDTPTRTTDGIYHEFGIGLGDRFNILRIDLVRNSIAGNRILVSLNVLR